MVSILKITSLKKVAPIGLVVVIILLALLFNPLIERWNDDPKVYLFFFASFATVFFFLFYYILTYQFILNRIDWLIVIAALLLIITQLLDHRVFPFYLSDGFISLTAVLCMYVPLKHISKKSTGVLLYVFFLLMLIELSIGLFQLTIRLLYDTYQSGCLTGSFKNSGIYSIFLCCCWPSFLFVNKKIINNFLRKCIYFILFFIVVIILLIDNSRTGFILMMIACFFYHRNWLCKIYTRFISKNNFYKILLLLLSFLIVVASVYLKYNSSIGRLLILKISAKMFSEKPLLGWGEAGFDKYYLFQQADYFKRNLSGDIAYRFVASDTVNSFNEYMMILVCFGSIGLIIFSFFIKKTYNFYNVYKPAGEYYNGLTLLLILISAFFYYSFHITLLAIIALGIVSDISANIPGTQLKYPIVKKITGGIIMLIFGLLFTYVFSQYKATLKWQEVIINNKQNKLYSSDLLKEVYPDLKHRSNFLYSYGTIMYQQRKYTNCISVLEECQLIQPSADLLLYLGKAYQHQNNYDKAEYCFTEASYISPVRFTPLYFLVELYLIENSKPKALILARQIMVKTVKVPSLEVERIKNKMVILLENSQ